MRNGNHPWRRLQGNAAEPPNGSGPSVPMNTGLSMPEISGDPSHRLTIPSTHSDAAVQRQRLIQDDNVQEYLTQAVQDLTQAVRDLTQAVREHNPADQKVIWTLGNLTRALWAFWIAPSEPTVDVQQDAAVREFVEEHTRAVRELTQRVKQQLTKAAPELNRAVREHMQALSSLQNGNRSRFRHSMKPVREALEELAEALLPNHTQAVLELTSFSKRLLFLQMIANNVGYLTFIWATAVLMGGFASIMRQIDFWFVTVILTIEGARISSRSYQLEWENYKNKLDMSCTYLLEWKYWCHCIVIFESTCRQFKPSRWQVIGAVVATIMSAYRLCTPHQFTRNKEEEDGTEYTHKWSLIIFYTLVISESSAFLIKYMYWRIKLSTLLKQANSKLEVHALPAAVKEWRQVMEYSTARSLLDDIHSKRIRKGIFNADPNKEPDVVEHVVSLLQSNQSKDQLAALHLLLTVSEEEKWPEILTYAYIGASETLDILATTPGVLERVVEMVSWKKRPQVVHIRSMAARFLLSLLKARCAYELRRRVASVLQSSIQDIKDLVQDSDTESIGLSILEKMHLLPLYTHNQDIITVEKMGIEGLRESLYDFICYPRTYPFSSLHGSILCMKRSLELLDRLELKTFRQDALLAVTWRAERIKVIIAWLLGLILCKSVETSWASEDVKYTPQEVRKVRKVAGQALCLSLKNCQGNCEIMGELLWDKASGRVVIAAHDAAEKSSILEAGGSILKDNSELVRVKIIGDTAEDESNVVQALIGRISDTDEVGYIIMQILSSFCEYGSAEWRKRIADECTREAMKVLMMTRITASTGRPVRLTRVYMSTMVAAMELVCKVAGEGSSGGGLMEGMEAEQVVHRISEVYLLAENGAFGKISDRGSRICLKLADVLENRQPDQMFWRTRYNKSLIEDMERRKKWAKRAKEEEEKREKEERERRRKRKRRWCRRWRTWNLRYGNLRRRWTTWN